MKYTLDTNIYIAAFRKPTEWAALVRFTEAYTPALYMTSVVAHELLAGARASAAAAVSAAGLSTAILRPYESRGRVAAPSYKFWCVAGTVRAALADRGHITVSGSFLNDILLAVTCREHGLALVTSNTRDFAAIKAELPGFRFVAPYP